MLRVAPTFFIHTFFLRRCLTRAPLPLPLATARHPTSFPYLPRPALRYRYALRVAQACAAPLLPAASALAGLAGLLVSCLFIPDRTCSARCLGFLPLVSSPTGVLMLRAAWHRCPTPPPASVPSTSCGSAGCCVHASAPSACTTPTYTPLHYPCLPSLLLSPPASKLQALGIRAGTVVCYHLPCLPPSTSFFCMPCTPSPSILCLSRLGIARRFCCWRIASAFIRRSPATCARHLAPTCEPWDKLRQVDILGRTYTWDLRSRQPNLHSMPPISYHISCLLRVPTHPSFPPHALPAVPLDGRHTERKGTNRPLLTRAACGGPQPAPPALSSHYHVCPGQAGTWTTRDMLHILSPSWPHAHANMPHAMR